MRTRYLTGWVLSGSLATPADTACTCAATPTSRNEPTAATLRGLAACRIQDCIRGAFKQPQASRSELQDRRLLRGFFHSWQWWRSILEPRIPPPRRSEVSPLDCKRGHRLNNTTWDANFLASARRH